MDKRRLYLIRATRLFALAGIAAVAYVYFGALLAPNPDDRSAVVTVDVSSLAPGAIMEVEGLHVPVWVLHRSEAMIAALAQVNPALADPQSQHSQQPASLRTAWRSVAADYFVFVPLYAWNAPGALHGYRRIRLLAAATPPSECDAGEQALAVGFVDESGGGVCFDYAGRVYRINGHAALQDVTNLPVPEQRLIGPGRLEIDVRGLALR